MSNPGEAPAFTPAVKVTVSDPQKQGDGMNAYISYKVTAQWLRKLEGVEVGTTISIRRFSDFEACRARLREFAPAAVAAALPEKQTIGRLTQEFVDTRCRALQRWCDAVAAHAVLGTSLPFVQFLTLSPDAYTALRASSGVSSLTGARARIFKFISGAVTAVASRGGGGASTSKSAEDMSFDELSSYTASHGPLLAKLTNESKLLAARFRSNATAQLEYGAALKALGTSEGGPAGAAVSAAALCVWATSTAAYEAAAQETELVCERLADLARNAAAVQEVMAVRVAASAALADALGSVEKVRAALSSAPPEKRAALEAELRSGQSEAVEARAEYDRTVATVMGEVKALRMHLVTELRAILLDLASIRLRQEKKVAGAYGRVVGEVDTAVTAERAANPAGVAAAAAVASAAAAAAVASA